MTGSSIHPTMRKGHCSRPPTSYEVHREIPYVPMGVKIRQEWLRRKLLKMNTNPKNLNEAVVQTQRLKLIGEEQQEGAANVITGDKEFMSEKEATAMNESGAIVIPRESIGVLHQESLDSITSCTPMASREGEKSSSWSRKASSKRTRKKVNRPKMSSWHSDKAKVAKTSKPSPKPKGRRYRGCGLLSKRGKKNRSGFKMRSISENKRRPSKVARRSTSFGNVISQRRGKGIKSTKSVRNSLEIGSNDELIGNRNLKVKTNPCGAGDEGKMISRPRVQNIPSKKTIKSDKNSKKVKNQKLLEKHPPTNPRGVSKSCPKKKKCDEKRRVHSSPRGKQRSTPKVDANLSKAAAPTTSVMKRSRPSKRANRQVQTTFKDGPDLCYTSRDLMTFVEVSRITETGNSSRKFGRKSSVSASQGLSPWYEDSFSTHSRLPSRRSSNLVMDVHQSDTATPSSQRTTKEDSPRHKGEWATRKSELLEEVKQKLSMTKCKGKLSSSEISYRNYQSDPRDSVPVFRPASLLRTSEQLGVPIGHSSQQYMDILHNMSGLQFGGTDKKSRNVKEKKKKKAKAKRSHSAKGKVRGRNK